MITDSYVFFWKGSIYSQWYPSPFELDGMTFNCAEQWMMVNKALLFGDEKMALKIMKTSSPAEQKRLGRKVAGFDFSVWEQHAKEIVYRGNYAKFTQDVDLKQRLLSTGSRKFVEASPADAVWGIGLTEQSAKQIPETEWPGKNWLGIVLTRLRDDLHAGE